MLSFFATTILGIALLIYLAIFILAPFPRVALKSEKTFRTVDANGETTQARPLPCWQDAIKARRKEAQDNGDFSDTDVGMEPPEVFMSLVVPAYNEQERISIMLTEAVAYLQQAYGKASPTSEVNGVVHRQNGIKSSAHGNASSNLQDEAAKPSDPTGWEILIVSDGSTDKTAETALEFARDLGSELSQSVRVVSLRVNKGKGGAVTHGMRHVRGQYAIFADADGASRFEDLGKLLTASKKVEDAQGRSVAVGSRAHLVGSEAVVKRSFIRQFLMHSFHFLLRVLTPPATSAIRDTQCGFKLFSRASLPYIIPHMHSEGWIFDVEMLMLAESAKIPVVEVPIAWQEVGGSKLNVLWDSLGMAWGLAVLRAGWAVGVYARW